MNQPEATMDATASSQLREQGSTIHNINLLHRNPDLSEYWKNFRHSQDTTLFGIDSFIASFPVYKSSKIGFVTNNAATTTEGKSSRKALLQAGFKLVRLFSPEHGINALGEDGLSTQWQR
jgi:hypothetical protein